MVDTNTKSIQNIAEAMFEISLMTSHIITAKTSTRVLYIICQLFRYKLVEGDGLWILCSDI